MFDFDAGKLIVIGIVALVAIPSKDLPRVLRQLGQLTGKMRRMAAEFQGQFMDAMREAWDAADVEWQRAVLGLVYETVTVLPAAHKGQRFNEDRVRPVFREHVVALG